MLTVGTVADELVAKLQDKQTQCKYARVPGRSSDVLVVNPQRREASARGPGADRIPQWRSPQAPGALRHPGGRRAQPRLLLLACCRLPGGVHGTGRGIRRGAAPIGDGSDWSADRRCLGLERRRRAPVGGRLGVPCGHCPCSAFPKGQGRLTG
jgi:hypothetical protein